jgi:hypothetical protein
MKRLIRALAAAALATAAVAAAPALAHDREPCPPAHHRPAGAYYPAPRPAPPPPPVRWERRELRREYAELEHARKRFYATWNGNPGKARKFERWHAVRKAELDRRWVALAANW